MGKTWSERKPTYKTTRSATSKSELSFFCIFELFCNVEYCAPEPVALEGEGAKGKLL